MPVSEVYIAGNTLKHGEAMQAAIKICERFGVPFALPAYGFRLDRARAGGRPARSPTATCTTCRVDAEAAPDGDQAAVRHRRPRRWRCWLLSPLLVGGGAAHQAHLARPHLLQAGARGPARQAVPHAQVPLHGGERRGAEGQARGAERAERPGLQDEERPAHHRASAASSASTPSTSCPSSSTCCAAT